MRKLALCLLVAALLLGLLELRLRTVQVSPTLETLPASGVVRVLALGDSITRGIDGEGGSYPLELQKILSQNSKSKIEVINGGIAGLETFDLARSVDETLDRFRPEVVITMIGNADITFPQQSWLGSRLRVWRLFALLQDAWQRSRWKDSLAKNTAESDSLEYIRSFGAVLRGEKRYAEAIKAHLEVLKKNPQHQMAHIELGQIYKELGKLELAESFFRKAINLGKDSPDHARRYSWAYVLLLLLHEDAKQWAKADETASEIEKNFPPTYRPYDFLAEHFRKRNKPKERDRVLAEAVFGRPQEARYHLLWAKRLAELGREGEAKEQTLLAGQIEQSGKMREVTGAAYRELSQKLRTRGILHLAMQYPRRDVAALRELLGSESASLRFVDNGPNFEAAMRGRKFGDFFIDDFGGNFGHMTPLANRVTAENVWRVLGPWLRERKLVD